MNSAAVLGAARIVLMRNPGASLNEVATATAVSRATLYGMFGPGEGLRRLLNFGPARVPGGRVRAAALVVAGGGGWAKLWWAGAAAPAGVPRASLYRLFPGKPAL